MEVRLILGDQLNAEHSWFTQVNSDVFYVMFEMRQETDYVKHHIQKIIAFFSAMRNFAKAREQEGHQFLYYTLDDPENEHDLASNLKKVISRLDANRFAYLLPDEYRLDQQLDSFCKELTIPSKSYDSEHFLTTRDEMAHFFSGKKKWVMEFFYRYMRKKFDILMAHDQPEGGSWNYDKFNRNKWNGSPDIPPPFDPKVDDIDHLQKMIEHAGVKTIGSLSKDHFLFPTTREESIKQLDYFCQYLLANFGTFQDAMHQEQTNLFHARISFALNVKIIHPLEVINHAIDSYRKQPEIISLSQVEGFVRQVLGWREYIRGLYWKEMPRYKELNALENNNPLPEFYWTGNTKMNCLSTTIKNSLEHAYAHHIQRLMITGNFALLAQTHPDAVDQWYLGIYADAVEWVQLPNTRGMSQYADGGMVATKPYVSSGSYVNKMSNYCASCSYHHKKRLGDDACPFNSLYWNFLDDKKDFLKGNNRMGMMLNLLRKINPEELAAIKTRAYEIIANPDAY